MKIYKCNICGRTIDEYDVESGFAIQYRPGWRSKYDNECVNVDLCVDCSDAMIDTLIALCKIHPIQNSQQETDDRNQLK